jgi:hypothetical protein
VLGGLIVFHLFHRNATKLTVQPVEGGKGREALKLNLIQHRPFYLFTVQGKSKIKLSFL